MTRPVRRKNFTAYFTDEESDQVRAAFAAAGEAEGDASVSDFIVRATMREVKRLQRKYNGGRKWPGLPAGSLRPGRRTSEETAHRKD
jgi:hypothetical protein